MLSFLKRRWYWLLILVIIGGVFFWYQTSTSAQSKKIKKYTVKRQTLRDTLTLSGNVNAGEVADLRFQTSGKLTWVGVKEGDTVKKGQGIASLDQRDVRNKMQQYLNSYVKVRNSFDQSVDDNGRNVNEAVTVQLRNEANRLVQDAQYDLNNSVLNVQLQQLAIEYSYLSSPIDGVVTTVETPVTGVNITPATADFVVVNPESIYFSALADQTDVVKLSQGMQGEIVFDSFPDTTLASGIETIAYTPKAGESGTVYEVKLTFDQYRLPIRIGMSGDADFTIGEHKNVLAVPTTYIKSDASGKYVMTKKEGKEIKMPVKTNDVFDTQTEITSGLKEGDVIYD